MNYEQKYFLYLIKAFLNSENIAEPNEDIDWHLVYKYACEQSLYNLFYCALNKLKNKPDDEVMAKLKSKYKRSVMTYAKKNYEAKATVELIASSGIKVLPLKGYFIKEYYLQPEFRYVSDLDIITSDTDKTNEVLANNGYELIKDDLHHSVFQKNGAVTEVHKSLFVGKLKKFFSDEFENALEIEKNIYRMDDNYFYAYVIAHFAYHFSSSGAGIRSIIDVYYLNKNLNITDKSLISDCSLSSFEKEISSFALSLFEGKEYDEDLAEILYLSHTNGLYENRAVIDSARQGKGRLIKKVFPSVEYLSTAYPIEKKSQLPYFWAKRLVDASRRNKREYSLKVDDERVKKFNNIISKLGLENF